MGKHQERLLVELFRYDQIEVGVILFDELLHVGILQGMLRCGQSGLPVQHQVGPVAAVFGAEYVRYGNWRESL